jgi:hypothetical protein
MFSVISVCLAGLVALYLIVPVEAGSQAYAYTGSVQHFTVPSWVTTITVEAYGAQGGTNTLNRVVDGGRGAYIKATISVTPSSTLDVYVGGKGGDQVGSVGGAGGYNGGGAARGPRSGGGGGGTDVRPSGGALSQRLVVAGGGGGGDHSCSDTTTANLYGSGFGGCDQGGVSSGACVFAGGTVAGGGALDSGGDAATYPHGGAALPGGFGFGGDSSTNYGGGGGGGYYGGGGGDASGGGGGSSYTVGVKLTCIPDYTTGHGYLMIRYNDSKQPSVSPIGAPSSDPTSQPSSLPSCEPTSTTLSLEASNAGVTDVYRSLTATDSILTISTAGTYQVARSGGSGVW